MKIYEKPVVSVDAGLAEGVYAASGVSEQIKVTYSSTNSWGAQDAFNYNVTWASGNLYSMTLTFDHKINSASAGTSNINVSGNSVTFEYGWGLNSRSENICIVVDTGLSGLKLVSSSCDIRE